MAENAKLYNTREFDANKAQENIIAVFEYVMNTTMEQELIDAINWYPIAHGFCALLAQTFGLETFQFAGIVAALSPQLSWQKNKAQALEFVARAQNGQSLSGLMAYPANLEKARRILAGENPLNVLGGNKVRSFYLNIMLDESAVTIDRHATSIALYGLSVAKSGQVSVTDKLYRLLAQAYKDVALSYSITPYVLQSVTWTYKAINGGKVQ